MPDVAWRLPVFLFVLVAMAAAEARWPRRHQAPQRRRRWLAHGGVQLTNTLVLRLLFPGAAVGIAVLAQNQSWGLLAEASLPGWLLLLATVLILDLAIYAQHVATHYWPWLWRLHRMHHSDTLIDTTTALRFHPLEIVLSMLWKGSLIVALGLPPLAVLIYETMLNAMALFNHANLRMPLALDRVLRWLVVTPDAHRVHHSVHPEETNANFGNTLSIWDRLFGTWREQPRDGHTDMKIGLAILRQPQHSTWRGLLLQPWRSS